MNAPIITPVKDWQLRVFQITLVTVGIIVGVLSVNQYWAMLTLMQAQNSLMSVMRVLHDYHDQNGHFPLVAQRDHAGVALHSWRTPLIPTLPGVDTDAERLQGFDFDKPWDDPANRAIAEQHPLTRFPYQVLAIVGPGAAWDDHGVRKFADFKDGPSQTVMAIAVRNTKIAWYEPRDANFDGERLWLGDPANKQPAPIAKDIFLLMADGTVRHCEHGLSPETLRAVITIDAGDDPGEDW